MSKVHVRKGDKVMVIAGKDKGKIGQVMEVLTDTSRVIVSEVNILTRHKKPKSREDKGGIVKAPGAIDSSNVMIICAGCNKPTRIAHKVGADGKKIRVCAKCGIELAITKSQAKKAVKTEKPIKAEKPAKVVAAEKPAKVVAADKPVKIEKTVAADKTVKTEKVAKAKTTTKESKEVKE